jgi:hypothetical protein
MKNSSEYSPERGEYRVRIGTHDYTVILNSAGKAAAVYRGTRDRVGQRSLKLVWTPGQSGGNGSVPLTIHTARIQAILKGGGGAG